jgi:hypothetical protein
MGNSELTLGDALKQLISNNQETVFNLVEICKAHELRINRLEKHIRDLLKQTQGIPSPPTISSDDNPIH